MKNVRPLSAAESEHECVTSKRHATDKKKNEEWKAKAWIPDELPDHREKPPGLSGRWNELRPGTAYRWAGGMMCECSPKELLQAREALRKKFPTYQGQMVRKTKKGVARDAWVSRKLDNPVAGVLVTLAPWQVRLLKDAKEEERNRILRKAYEAAIKALDRAGWQPFGLDEHWDTCQPHATISCLRVDEKTRKIIPMPAASKWTVVMDRLERAGIQHPDEQRRKWHEENMTRHGVTPNIEAHRAADTVLADWIKEKNVPHLEKKYRDEYVSWQRDWQTKRQAQTVARAANVLSRMTKMAVTGYVTAKLMQIAGEAFTHRERDKKMEEQLKVAAAMDQVS